MINLQKLGGVAALFQAILYVSAFIFFGLYWNVPSDLTASQELVFLIENQITLTIVNLFIYVVFGVFLAVLVLACHEHLKGNAKVLSQTASIFGLIWVGLVIASGMIANIGLKIVSQLSEKDPEQASTVWLAIDSIAEGIGGGNEIVGGLWVLILSLAALKSNAFSKKLNYLGLFVGLAGISTVYPAETLTEIFGLSQILWFTWLGFALLKEPSEQSKGLTSN